MTVSRSGVRFRRVVWLFPWALTRWWVPSFMVGSDEWCNQPACFTVPPLGCVRVYQFWAPLREQPCTSCWLMLDDESRADYLPGGCLEGGRVHQGREPAGVAA